jgi:hypothetical protein
VVLNWSIVHSPYVWLPSCIQPILLPRMSHRRVRVCRTQPVSYS